MNFGGSFRRLLADDSTLEVQAVASNELADCATAGAVNVVKRMKKCPRTIAVTVSRRDSPQIADCRGKRVRIPSPRSSRGVAAVFFQRFRNVDSCNDCAFDPTLRRR